MASVSHPSELTLSERVRTLVEEVLASTPHYIVDLEVKGAVGSQSITIFVDSDTNVGVDDLASISRDVGFLIDTEDLFPSRYQLTVSTPGVDRPLKLHRQYLKNIGRTLHVHFEKAEGGNTEVKGELLSVSEDVLLVNSPKGEVTIPFSAIKWAKVKLPW